MKANLLALAAILVSVAPIHAQSDPAAVEAIIRERATAHGVSGDYMVAVARCESRLIPDAVGDGGASIGVMQIHERGLYPLFLRWGYQDRVAQDVFSALERDVPGDEGGE